MKFYDRVIRDLQAGDQTLKSIYDITFSFSEEVYLEESVGMDIVKYTYRDCQREIERVSDALIEIFSDLPSDSAVGLKLPNCREWVVIFWALIRAGFKPMLLAPAADEKNVSMCARGTGMKYVISDKDVGGAEFKDYKEIFASVPVQTHEGRWADHIILSTSGTTGEPKIFGYSGKAIAAQTLNSGYIISVNKNFRRFYKGAIRQLVVLPFYHIFGLTAVLLWYGLFGRTFVLLKDLRPDTILATAQYHNVSHVFAVPLLWDSLADGVMREAKKTNQLQKLEKGVKISLALQNFSPALGRFVASKLLFKSVRERLLGNGISIGISGGGAIRPDSLRLLNAIGYPLHVGYGMTEIGITSVELRKRPKELMEASVGKPLPSLEYELRPDDEMDGDVLWVRGISCFSARYIGGDVVSHDPSQWYCTGDFFRRDEKGNYFFVGRNADMINGSNGELISLVSIESRLNPKYVLRGCAVGRELPDGQSEICYVFEPAGQMPAFRIARIMDYIAKVNETLPVTHRIKRVYMASAPLPESYNGKIKRNELSRGIESGEFPAVRLEFGAYRTAAEEEAGAPSEIVDSLCGCFAEILGCSKESVRPDSHFLYDLSGNSMQYLALLDCIEKEFGVAISADGNSCATPAEFAAFIAKL
ncbi:MAG: AMP-binding protein [Clostridia bacterium]|nr:AMP-binding protein [Clostridia bacterium]